MTHVEDNSHAGQGAVLVDIGGSVGALVVTMPASLVGREVEIRSAGGTDAHGHRRHVAVVNRPRDGGTGELVASAVFDGLEEGDYELYLEPDGPVQVAATVTGAEVEFAAWPGC